MTRRYAPLNERQLEVLRWVGQGCPDGTWTDFSYKRTAYALADRRLVAVDKRRGSWSATLTDQGSYYLEARRYRDEPEPPRASLRGNEPGNRGQPEVAAPPVEISPADLLLQLQNSELVVRVSNPPHDERAAYRSAISRAITYGLVPGGYALRHKGRDRGDLVIRLVSLAESPPPVEPLPPIPVPKTLRDAHAAVRMLRDEAHSMDVSSESKPRALLLVQAIGDECARRGYTLSRTEDVGTTFWISIGDDQFPFTLAEEFERREVLDEKQLAAAKYAWQRVPARVRQVRSGRLLLRLGSGYGSVFWADRRRWSLDEKLPAMFKEIEDRAERQVAARISAEARRVARLQEWERALLRARQAYIEDLNRGRLTKQVAASGQAVAIRAYCDRIGAILDQTADDHRSQVNQWLAWARAEADRVDPLSHPKSLAYVLPDDVRTSELGRFMPKGMSAWHPPS